MNVILVSLRTARLSILFSIIRIIPDKAQERLLYRAAIAFVVVLVFLLAQVFWVCEDPGALSASPSER